MKKQAVLLTLAILGTAHARAQSPDAAPTPAKPATLRAVSAEINVTMSRRLKDGNTVESSVVQHFYRDGSGRTRLDQGDMATISDVVSGTVLVLDLKGRTARKFALPEPPALDGTLTRTRKPAPGTPAAKAAARAKPPLGL